jgi:phosphate uptake regulator
MLKELLSLFRTDDAIALMGEDFDQMLDLSRDVTVRAGSLLFGEGAEANERKAIHQQDVKINQLERRIRKRVIAHLTLGAEASSVSYCLLLMSLVKDVERLGDYAKNLAQIRHMGGGPVPDDDNGTEIGAIRTLVEGTFGAVKEVFASSDVDTANALIKQGQDVNRRCDRLITAVVASAYTPPTTTTMVLAARHYKRIGSHLLNVLSSVVMPLHKLDYYDEDSLDSQGSTERA